MIFEHGLILIVSYLSQKEIIELQKINKYFYETVIPIAYI